MTTERLTHLLEYIRAKLPRGSWHQEDLNYSWWMVSSWGTVNNWEPRVRSQSWVVLHYKEKQPQQHKQVLTVNTGENTPPSSSRWREKDILGDTPEHSVLNHVCPPEKQVPRVSSAAVYQRLPGLGEREYPTPASDSLPCGEEKDLPQTSLCHSDPLKRKN